MAKPKKSFTKQVYHCTSCGSPAIAAPVMANLNSFPQAAGGADLPLLTDSQLEKCRRKMLESKKFFVYCVACDTFATDGATTADLKTLMPEVLS